MASKRSWFLPSRPPVSPPLMDAQSRERGQPHFGYSVLSVFGRPPAAAGWKKSDDSCQQKVNRSTQNNANASNRPPPRQQSTSTSTSSTQLEQPRSTPSHTPAALLCTLVPFFILGNWKLLLDFGISWLSQQSSQAQAPFSQFPVPTPHCHHSLAPPSPSNPPPPLIFPKVPLAL